MDKEGKTPDLARFYIFGARAVRLSFGVYVDEVSSGTPLRT
jgi:hypothetical protein